MTKRGRTSLAELLVPENPTEVVQRPDAPYDLDDEESAEWRVQVNAMPADHFPSNTYPILAQYCRHIVASRRIAQLTQTLTNTPKGRRKNFDLDTYTQLLTAQRQETAAMCRLATKMRLTQQSQVRPEVLSRKQRDMHQIQAPWANEDED